MAQSQPFRLHVSDQDLKILETKLSTSRLPRAPDGWTNDQGVPIPDIERILEYWRTSYLPKWREREAELNKLPMFKTAVDAGEFGSLNIHYMQKKASKEGAIPLLFIHGWPGCFLEATKLLDALVDGDASEDGPVFDVVVPSLPNYGFSEGVSKKGFHLGQYATVLHNLMQTLGYPQYVIQGGDWGSMISRIQARMFPAAVRAVHVNMAGVRLANLLWSPLLLIRALVTPWTKAERTGLARGKEYMVSGNGYYQIQSTRPLTVAYCLADSPVALLGWVLEKMRAWSDDANVAWSDDELLDWISVYWFSEAGPGSSVYTYHEAEAGMKAVGGFWEYMPAPLGVTQFPSDLVGMPRMFLRTLGNVVFERWADRGGHFAAWEVPDELVRDLRLMFGRDGGAFGVVEGKNGYPDSKKER